MRRRTLLAAAVPMLAAAAAGTAAVVSGWGSTPGTTRSAATGIGTVETFLAADRRPAPTVTGELLDGTRFDLAGWHGQVVVVNFWGSWCAPCRAEAPDLQATYGATTRLGVQFLGVDVRDSRDAAKAFQTAFHIGYPSLFDPPGQVSMGFNAVSPNVVPATLLLDRQLRVAAVFRRRVTGRELEAAVRALATEDGA
jgi:peroxiredoxin